MFPIVPRHRLPIRPALVLALALAPLSLPAFAHESADENLNVAAVEPAPAPAATVRSSGATKGAIAGGFFGAIAGTMLAASMETERETGPNLLFFEGPLPARGGGVTPVHRVGVGLAMTVFGTILGRTIGATSDRRAAVRRHGDLVPAIDHALRDLRVMREDPAPRRTLAAIGE